MTAADTIAAIFMSVGVGGIGIVRLRHDLDEAGHGTCLTKFIYVATV